MNKTARKIALALLLCSFISNAHTFNTNAALSFGSAMFTSIGGSLLAKHFFTKANELSRQIEENSNTKIHMLERTIMLSLLQQQTTFRTTAQLITAYTILATTIALAYGVKSLIHDDSKYIDKKEALALLKLLREFDRNRENP